VIEHPSVSNYGEKIAWLQKVGTSNHLFVRDIAANTNTQVLSTTNLLDHPHLSADGNYLTFAQQVSGK
jgi:Tol biopolymer transport system component